MNDQWIRSFREVAKMKSISKAAANLFITPQALMQQMDLLEREVGVKLFERNNRGTFLTAAGVEFRTGMEQVEAIFTRTLQNCRGAGARRALRIPVCSRLVVAEMLEKTCRLFEKVQNRYTTELVETEFDNDVWVEGLFSHRYDIIQYHSLGGNHPGGTHYLRFADVPTWCLMDKDNPLACKETITLDMLQGCSIANPSMELMSYVLHCADERGIGLDVTPIPVERFHILRACEEGKVCFMSYEAGVALSDLEMRPLDFETHVEFGLLCLETHAEDYRAFFDAAATALNE